MCRRETRAVRCTTQSVGEPWPRCFLIGPRGSADPVLWRHLGRRRRDPCCSFALQAGITEKNVDIFKHFTQFLSDLSYTMPTDKYFQCFFFLETFLDYEYHQGYKGTFISLVPCLRTLLRWDAGLVLVSH